MGYESPKEKVKSNKLASPGTHQVVEKSEKCASQYVMEARGNKKKEEQKPNKLVWQELMPSKHTSSGRDEKK